MFRHFCALALASLVSLPALAQVSVSDPWIRATVPQQKTAGAFMQLRSVKPARLVEVKSPVAGRVELHQMAMEGQTMRMRAVESIDLPAGQTVNLASGGYHVMLFDLKRQLKDGEQVPLTLTVVDAGGKRENVTLSVPVRPLTYTAPGAAPGAAPAAH
jgi:copper(I)-binding protein